MKIKPCLSKDSLLIIYHSLLISHIRYCINNWCFENSTLIRKLQSICNRFLKITFNLQHNSDVTEAMKDAQLLIINNLYNLEIVQMMFKYKNKQLPPAFNNFFTQKSLKMKTRSNSQIISNCFRTKVSQQSLKFVGPKPGLRTRSIFNRVRVRVRVYKKFASPSSSSLNFNFTSSSSSSSSQNKVEKIQSE